MDQSAATTARTQLRCVFQRMVDPGNLQFPWRLHLMLADVERQGMQHVISWLPDGCGRGFRVHMPSYFVSDVMVHYFNQTKIKSFQRQLNMWGFQRIVKGPHRGGYTHPYFIQGFPDLCERMVREKVKSKSAHHHEQVTSASTQQRIEGHAQHEEETSSVELDSKEAKKPATLARVGKIRRENTAMVTSQLQSIHNHQEGGEEEARKQRSLPHDSTKMMDTVVNFQPASLVDSSQNLLDGFSSWFDQSSMKQSPTIGPSAASIPEQQEFQPFYAQLEQQPQQRSPLNSSPPLLPVISQSRLELSSNHQMSAPARTTEQEADFLEPRPIEQMLLDTPEQIAFHRTWPILFLLQEEDHRKSSLLS